MILTPFAENIGERRFFIYFFRKLWYSIPIKQVLPRSFCGRQEGL